MDRSEYFSGIDDDDWPLSNNLIEFFQAHKYADVRDHVLGLIGLCCKAELRDCPITVDYS
jgi:hypothetical protein